MIRGKDIAFNRGLWNFDEVRFDYFRDNNTAFEAFKKGLADIRVEPDPTRWSQAYDFPAATGSPPRVEVSGFESLTATLPSRLYHRTPASYSGPTLSYFGPPADAPEMALLGADAARIDPPILHGSYAPPKTDGSGRDRKVL